MFYQTDNTDHHIPCACNDVDDIGGEMDMEPKVGKAVVVCGFWINVLFL